MDEKRAIVAVVLIFVVLFGFNYFQAQQRNRAASEQAGVEDVAETVDREAAATSTGDELADERVSGESEEGDDRTPVEPEADVPPVAVAPERTITVESPLWVATLSSQGGAITSWRLKEYDTRLEDRQPEVGEPVELVSEGATGLSLSIGYGPRLVDTDAWTFDTDAPERIVLDGSRGSAAVRFQGTGEGGVTVAREYTFYADGYAFDARIDVAGLSDPSVRRDIWVEWPGVAPTEAREDTKAPASVARVDGGVTKDGLGRFKEETEYPRVGEVEWVTSQSRYFMAAVAPVDGMFRETRAVGDREARTVGFKAAMPVEGESASVALTVFAGPQVYTEISAMGVGLERAIDMGWSFTRPLSVLLLRALVWAHKYIPNYGVVIIIFSILTKLLFYRLTHKSFTEMKRMQDVQPKLNALKEKLGDDKEALAKAQMELYKKEGVNPLGSCLPMILQMPVFIALFQVLRTTIELRGAPFLLWITDLSQPDTIAAIAGFPIHVLPLLMGLGMLVQQRFTTAESSQAAMTKMMPILFTVLFYNFASGLVVYWLVNTILSIGQQYYIHRGPSASAEVSPDAAAPDGVLENARTSVTGAPEFQEAEVVEADDKRSAESSSQSKKRRRRRRKKK